MRPSRLQELRLLPLTIAGLLALLLVKTSGLVGAAYGAGETAVPAGPPAHAAPAATALADAAPSHPAPSGTKAAELPPPVAAMPPPPDPPPSAAERSLLLDLRKRRAELDAKAVALDQREALLAAAEKRIGARVAELASLQQRLEALEAARRDRDEASWRGLVRVYETMKPKDAAAIFNDLDSPVLLQVVDRMREARAAAILAAMTPDRARRLTADLSALRSRANAAPEAGASEPASSRAPAEPATRPARPVNPPPPVAPGPSAPAPGASP